MADGGAVGVPLPDLVDFAGEESADALGQWRRGTLEAGLGVGELDQEELNGFG